MGSANSHAEELERRRIEREMRLGLYAGSTTGVNARSMDMRPVGPSPGLWRIRPPPRQGVVQLRCDDRRTGMGTMPPSALRLPVNGNGASALQRGDRGDGTQTRARTVLSVSPTRPYRQSADLPSPTRLRWVGTPPKHGRRSPSPMDLLAPARRTLQLLQSREKKRPPVGESNASTRSPHMSMRAVRDSTRGVEHGRTALKPSLKHALYLLSLEEVEDRTYLLKEEVDTFDRILAMFSHAVEMEFIRIAAFELFSLEKKSRKTVEAQEQRERLIMEYWLAENYDDAKLTEKIRAIQLRQSQQRTPSQSPWRFLSQPSENRTVQATTINREPGRGDSYLANPYPSPPPVPPSRRLSGWPSPEAGDMRFASSNRYVDELPISPRGDASARFGVRQKSWRHHHTLHASQGNTTPLCSGPGQSRRSSHRQEGIASGPTHAGEYPLVWGNSAEESLVNAPSAAPQKMLVHDIPTQEVDAMATPYADSIALSRKTPPAVASVINEPLIRTRSNEASKKLSSPSSVSQRHEEDPAGTSHGSNISKSSKGPLLPSSGSVRSVSNAHATATRHLLSIEDTKPFNATVVDDLAPYPDKQVPLHPHRNEDNSRASMRAKRREAPNNYRGVSPRGPPKRAAPAPWQRPEDQPRPSTDCHPSLRASNMALAHLSSSHDLGDLSPIEASLSEEDGASSSSVYLDPFAIPKPGRPWSSSAANWKPKMGWCQDELDRKIMQQRSSMMGGAAPARIAPSAPISLRGTSPEDERRHYDVMHESAAVVKDRFAALLNAFA